jgi:hypothetical protein
MRRILQGPVEGNTASGGAAPVAMMLCDRHADRSVAVESSNQTPADAPTQLSCMWAEEGQTLSCGASPAAVRSIELPSGSNGVAGMFPPLALVVCSEHAERFAALVPSAPARSPVDP